MVMMQTFEDLLANLNALPAASHGRSCCKSGLETVVFWFIFKGSLDEPAAEGSFERLFGRTSLNWIVNTTSVDVFEGAAVRVVIVDWPGTMGLDISVPVFETGFHRDFGPRQGLASESRL